MKAHKRLTRKEFLLLGLAGLAFTSLFERMAKLFKGKADLKDAQYYRTLAG